MMDIRRWYIRDMERTLDDLAEIVGSRPRDADALISGIRLLAEERKKRAYVFERLEEILPCGDDNRPIEHHARKVVAYVTRLRDALQRIVDNHEMYCENHRDVSAHSHEAAQIAADALYPPHSTDSTQKG